MIETCGGTGSVVDIENEISETSGLKPSEKLLLYRSAERAAPPNSKNAGARTVPRTSVGWVETSVPLSVERDFHESTKPTEEVPVRRLT